MSASSVNVEVDAKPQADMSSVMADIRAQYEGIAEKNRREMESWYKAKVTHTRQAGSSSGSRTRTRADE